MSSTSNVSPPEASDRPRETRHSSDAWGLFRGRQLPWPVAVLFAADIFLIAAHLVNALTGDAFGWTIMRFFELEFEQNLPTWFSSTQLATAAILLGTFVVFEVSRQRARIWSPAIIAAITLLLSLDEISQIHEDLGFRSDVLLPAGSRSATIFPYSGIWAFLLGIPFVVVMLLLFAPLVRRSRPDSRGFRRLLSGLMALVAGAAGVEIWGNFTFDQPRLHFFQVVLEEGLELFGATIMVWGSIEVLRANGIRLIRLGDPSPRS